MTHQLTILNPDNSFVEAFFISDSLHDELSTIATVFELHRLNLAFLHEIKARALSVCSEQIQTIELKQNAAFASAALASVALDWFDELTALITALEKLKEPHSLGIFLAS